GEVEPRLLRPFPTRRSSDLGIQDMMKHVTSWWHYLYMGLGLLVVIFGTIPRCGGVAYETGFEGIFGSLPVYARIIFLLLFFGISDRKSTRLNSSHVSIPYAV